MEFADLIANKRRARSTTRVTGNQPLMCASRDCVSLLLRLSFDRSETESMLKSIQGDIDTDHLVVGALYRTLTTLVRENSEAAVRVDSELRKRLGARAHLLEDTCMREIARVWNDIRDEVDGLSASALLWIVARSKSPCWRRLESVMVEDLHYRSARSFTATTCSTCPPSALTLGSAAS